MISGLDDPVHPQCSDSKKNPPSFSKSHLGNGKNPPPQSFPYPNGFPGYQRRGHFTVWVACRENLAVAGGKEGPLLEATGCQIFT